MTDLLSIGLIVTRKETTQKGKQTQHHAIINLLPDEEILSPEHKTKWRRVITEKIPPASCESSINYLCFVYFVYLRRLHLKPEKFDPIPLVPLDQINFISTLSRLVDREGPTTKQLYSHARALDVLIATLFKRLYNFQSFLMRFALVARCGNYLSILRDFARDPKACLTRNKNLSKHKTDFAVEWMDGYFGESSKVINTVVVFFRVRAKSAKSKS